MSILIKPKKPSLSSSKGKADLKASIAKDEAKAALQENSPIQTRAAIKGFWAQYPKACQVFGRIMVKWRGSSATRQSVPGFWAAYPYRNWVEVTGVPQRTLQRHLDLLEQYGMIERDHGQHEGRRQLMFIRPTELALKLSDGIRPQDWEHLFGKPHKKTPSPKPVQSMTGGKTLTPPLGIGGKPSDQPQTLEELNAILNAES